MKLSMFPKVRPGCENESSKYVNGIGRFITGRTTNLDRKSAVYFLVMVVQMNFNFIFYRHSDPIFIVKSPQNTKFNWCRLSDCSFFYWVKR